MRVQEKMKQILRIILSVVHIFHIFKVVGREVWK